MTNQVRVRVGDVCFPCVFRIKVMIVKVNVNVNASIQDGLYVDLGVLLVGGGPSSGGRLGGVPAVVEAFCPTEISALRSRVHPGERRRGLTGWPVRCGRSRSCRIRTRSKRVGWPSSDRARPSRQWPWSTPRACGHVGRNQLGAG